MTATREAARCTCTHTRAYHKSGVGPCWFPVKLRSGGAKPELCDCREYKEARHAKSR